MIKPPYRIKHKISCKDCGCLVAPHIKKAKFRGSKAFLYAAYCPRCGKYMENIPEIELKGD